MSDLFKHTIKGAEVLSLYPIIYVSSKGEPMLIDDAEAMNDFRLTTVCRKLSEQDELHGEVGRLFEALKEECVRRGLDYRIKGGRPPLAEPPQEEGFA